MSEMELLSCDTCNSEHISISRLGKFLIDNHLVFNADKNFLHCIFSFPVLEYAELGWLYSSSCLIDDWHVDFRVEADFWSLGWVVRTTLYCQEVDAVVVVSVCRAN